MKTMIVTGGAGFIGSNFIKKNVTKYKIINIDSLTYASNLKFLNSISKSKNYKFYKTDIRNTKKITDIIKKYNPNFLFNFAAQSHVDNSIKNSDDFVNTNILGTHSLLKSVLKNKKLLNSNFKFIQISTDEVFGDVKKNYHTKESDRYNPSSPYSSSKAAADHLVTSWGRTYNIKYNITYSSNNFGPNQNNEKFIPVILYSILNNKKIPVYGDGQQRRDWIYVKDNIDGILKVATHGKTNQSYNVGSNYSLTNLALIKKICFVLITKFNFNKKIYNLIEFVKDRPGHDRNYSLDSSKLNNINWKCNFDFNSAIEQTIRWYLVNK
jgi:dTDP-glucose 4,6-dehydratase